jgi:hypothetical protein
MFCETFRIILPDTPYVLQRNSSESQADETEIDALDSLCVRLNDRQIIHRVSDRQMTNTISEILRDIALIDDPSGQFRATQPRVYALNCRESHLAGHSQLRHWTDLKFPVRLKIL